ncbi:MAG: crotonase/enoyl-CoA hydratase family protein [Paracoccaceae bacterium]|jgi:methylglutaconyl-CoA hydratase|nr:crotonase/enoyl-CoA hydratase family protein [Paracoccaceae bacterium]MDG1677499.1 crotonase/enoyl-CoA hydratase family protein [Paracoccaceae bacterium]
MNFETLLFNQDKRGVVSLTLNRPEKRNALSAKMIEELTGFTSKLTPDTRAVVIQGAGKLFCAGGDLDWMNNQIKADRLTRISEARKLAMMLKALNEIPVPLIGKLHGAAYGGGVGLACVCDFVISSSNVKFGFTETRLGLIPSTIGPYVVGKMGEAKAREVFMSGQTFNEVEAKKLNIVSEISENLDQSVESHLNPYLQTAPKAVGEAKALLRSLGPRIDEQVIEGTIERLADIWEGEEASHGIDAFLNKTKPRWID